MKIVSAGCQEALENIAKVYEKVVKAGVHKAPTIEVAESAKIMENTQRDVNIALMNEFSIIFNHMGINTYDVLEAAGTKWNFLKFYPGLVGGHCKGGIGIRHKDGLSPNRQVSGSNSSRIA